MECSNCFKDLENDDDILTDDDDRCFCDDKCYKDYIAGWADYVQNLIGD